MIEGRVWVVLSPHASEYQIGPVNNLSYFLLSKIVLAYKIMPEISQPPSVSEEYATTTVFFFPNTKKVSYSQWRHMYGFWVANRPFVHTASLMGDESHRWQAKSKENKIWARIGHAIQHCSFFHVLCQFLMEWPCTNVYSASWKCDTTSGEKTKAYGLPL